MAKSLMKHIVERAFELAPSCANLREVHLALKSEGYSSVEAYLAGRSIRGDLAKLFNRPS